LESIGFDETDPIMSSYAKRFSTTKYLGDKTKCLEQLAANKTIIHLGCTDWPNQIEQISKGNLLHVKLLSSSKKCIGIDVDENGIAHMKERYKTSDFVCGDIATSKEIQDLIISNNPDYILIPDVLEHIENSRDFLLSVEKVLSRTKASAIFTTPNAFALKTIIPIFFGLDFTHPDHCLIHNEFTITHAMHDANLKIKGISYVSRDISERYGLILQLITKPFNWLCILFPRFADTLYVEVTSAH